jgi:hypothetical protein
MVVVDPVAGEFVEPGGGFYVLAAILVPVDVRILSQNTGGHEGADVETDTVVQVGLPAGGLLIERFPADEDVVGIFSLQNLLQFNFQFLGGGKADGGAIDPLLDLVFLAFDPVAQIGVDESFVSL